ncbi:MAG: cysteine hydrolase, partial [Rubrobacteridae bacterium]|nr:cysteine hydrolase [Rubrobacteridae bacterium]
IVVIEFQKTWTEKGFFNRLIKKEYESRNVLDNTTALLLKARTLGLHIIQAPLIIDKKDKKRYRKIPLPPKLFRGFIKGTWKAEFTEGIHEKTDVVVTGRCGFDATEGSNIEEILQQKEVKNIFLCGFTTDHCVELTMKTLISRGYNCALVSDCTATRNAAIQKKVENRNKTMTSLDVLNEVQ